MSTQDNQRKFYIAYPVEDSGVFETMHVTSAEVISVRFGKKKCKVILVETKDEAIYKGCMREIWRDLSKESREHRRGLPLSLEAEYMINGFEPEDPSDVEETKTLQIVLEELLIKLRKLNPKYADILEQLYEGCTQEEISIRTGKSLSTIQEQIALAFAIVRAMLEK